MKNLNNSQLITTFDISNFSNKNITFLSEQVGNKKLFQILYYHFFKIPNLELGILKYFLQILDFNKAYIVLPILATSETTGSGPILSLSKQILVTRDSNPLMIRNFLLTQIEMACSNYGIADLGNYTVVFKFRPIALKEEIVCKIPQIQYTQEKFYQTKILNLLKFKFFNGTILPLTMNLKMYKNKLNKFLSAYYILKFDLNPEGFFFKKDEFVIYIHVCGDKHEGILFKDQEILYKFEDLMVEGNNFMRIMDKYIIYIENFNISHFERLMNNNSFISPSKPNVKLNTKIVTFDIETYMEENKFVPFSCG